MSARPRLQSRALELHLEKGSAFQAPETSDPQGKEDAHLVALLEGDACAARTCPQLRKPKLLQEIHIPGHQAAQRQGSRGGLEDRGLGG